MDPMRIWSSFLADVSIAMEKTLMVVGRLSAFLFCSVVHIVVANTRLLVHNS
jgi:hypothetical protein